MDPGDFAEGAEAAAEEEDGDEAEEGDDHEGDGEDEVASAHQTQCSQQEVAVAVPLGRVVVVLHGHPVLARRQVALDLAPRLLEVRQSRSPHPDDEVLVLGVHPLLRLCNFGPLELLPLIALPGDALLVDGDLGAGGVVEREGVVEEGVGWVGAELPMEPQGLAMSLGLRGLPFQLRALRMSALVM